MQKIALIILASLFVFSCTKKETYDFHTKFDELNRKSTLFLTKDGVVVDSIVGIGSYYGKDRIAKINDHQWDYYYNGRCGTGCSVVYYMNLSPVDDKIKLRLNILQKYKESNPESQKTLTKEYLANLSLKGSIITKTIKENGMVKNKAVNPIEYDEKNDVYYNVTFQYDNSVHKGIKMDSLEYIVLGENNWKFFDSRTKKISDLQ